LTLALMLGACLSACGVKGPPVPPNLPPLPAATDLSYRMVRQTAILSWRLAKPPPTTWYRNWTFGIYRFRVRLDQPPCEGCPQLFDEVASVPYADTENLQFSVDVPLDSGYHYVFKVRLENDRYTGPDSNTVQFDVLPVAPPQSSETP
jgi:hypothetical protein